MKILAMAVASACTVLAPAAFAQYGRNDTARVISSTPVYGAAATREECWNPRAGHYEERREGGHGNTLGGTAAGAVIGGVIGHQFGGHDAGTALGAIAGGAIGHEVAREHNRDEQNDLDYSRCRTVSVGNGALQGYDVTYAYRAQEYTTRMDHDPGRRLVLGRDIRDDGIPYDSSVSSSTPSYSYDDRRLR